MEVESEHIPDEEFQMILDKVPITCVEIVLRHDDSVLLGMRKNSPARDRWFWPGGRLFKGETLSDAAHRIGEEELRIGIKIERKLGVRSHYWSGEETETQSGRHTVNTVFLVEANDPIAAIQPDEQHAETAFFSEPKDGFHEYVKEYFESFSL